jgi:hypothetical protein
MERNVLRNMIWAVLLSDVVIRMIRVVNEVHLIAMYGRLMRES